MSGLTLMLSKAGTDPNPEMKNKFASFSGRLATTLGKKCGGYLQGISETLISNLQHQHSKVRKTTLRGLRDVFCCKGAEKFMGENTLAQLKFAANDRSQDVRLEFYRVLFHWMENMDIYWLRKVEADFIQLLLNGISDDKLDIGPQCIQFLETHGKRMQEALKAMGENVEFSEDDQVEEQKHSTERAKASKTQSDTDMRTDGSVKASQQVDDQMEEID